jgi:hypothetical protein
MWREDLSKVLHKLECRKDAEFFREPVQWQSLGLLDYPTIVKKPMDFLTIKNNLIRNIYSNPEEVVVDIRLMFINAMTYNAPGSRVYTHAKSLSEFWELQWSSNPNRSNTDQDKPPTIELMTSWVDKCRRL